MPQARHIMLLSALLLCALSSGERARAGIPVPPLPYELLYTDGEASLSPSMMRARTEGHHLTLTVTLGPEGIQPGGGIDLVLGAQVVDLAGQPQLYTPQMLAWRPFQDQDPQQPSFLTVDAPPGKSKLVLEIPSLWSRQRVAMKLLRRDRHSHAPFSPKEMTAAFNRAHVQVQGAALPGGTRLTFRLGGTAPDAVGMTSVPRATRVRVAVLIDAQGSGSYKTLRENPLLEVVGGPAQRVQVVAPSTVRPAQPFGVVLQALDEVGERDILFEGTMTVRVRGSAYEKSVGVHSSDRGSLRVQVPGLAPGYYFLEAEGRDAAGKVLTRTQQPVVVSAEGPLLFWGDSHRHSVLADGFVAPEEVYRRAIEEEHLDWMCLSEHSHPDPLDAFGENRRRLLLSPSEWMALQSMADKYDAREDLTALLGYEWTSEDGHRNVYFHPDEKPEPLLSHYVPDGLMTVKTFLESYRDRKVVLIPHHPAWRLWGKPFDWGEQALANQLQRVVEVYSQHGNSEFFNPPRAIHAVTPLRPNAARLPFMRPRALLSPTDQAPEGAPGFVRNALAAGFRMGLTAASDNHFFDVGPISYRGGITGVMATENSRRGIWEGIQTRRVLATSGERLWISFQVSSLKVGEEGRLSGAPQVVGQVMGTAPLQKVEVLRHDGRGYVSVVKQEAQTGQGLGDVVQFAHSDDAFQAPGFYYLRVEQVDGALGWAGPIWVEKE